MVDIALLYAPSESHSYATVKSGISGSQHRRLAEQDARLLSKIVVSPYEYPSNNSH